MRSTFFGLLAVVAVYALMFEVVTIKDHGEKNMRQIIGEYAYGLERARP